ncbi:ABC transporter substrate-binding protein [Meiothermus sp.]|uniref:ABC transporter substrate-binding protein n=1 Tax=Meiothermus sp. TaxID=1955249 RepID=UPI0021DE59D7|nr:ABC transporter substrate-binding protein [Meiothermus sp.]GIW33340.1 MAG: ABC transporter permease [Meiothermus sp.]
MKRVLMAIWVILGLALGQGRELPKVSMVLNWFPQPSQGGFYAALADGLYKQKGIDLTIQPGGPNISSISLLAAGRVQLAMTDAAAVMFARDQGIPVVAIFAPFQTNPQGFMFHTENPVRRFEDLAGRTVAVSPGAAYWRFIEKKYNLSGKVQVVNYNGQLADWLRDKSRVTQCFVISEPFSARQQGANPGTLLIADSGFNPYMNLIVTTEQFLRDNPAAVKAFVEASQLGWYRYMGNPQRYVPAIQEVNQSQTPEWIVWQAEQQKPLVQRGDAVQNGIGYMSPERWKTLYNQLKDLELLKSEIDLSKVFTNQFVPKPR